MALVALVLTPTSWHSCGEIIVVFSIMWLWLWSAPAFTSCIGALLERGSPPIPVEEMETADAIVILGGGVMPAVSPRLYPEVNSAGNRVLHAARLYKAGKGQWIISSGWTGASSLKESSQRANPTCVLLEELGVPSDAVLAEERSLTTRQNARFTKELIEDHGFEKVLIVTSALHMRRALLEFQCVSTRLIPAPVDYRFVGNGKLTISDFIPSPRALDYGLEILHEIFGLIALGLRRT